MKNKILLLDDEHEIVLSLAKLLRRQYDIKTAFSAAEAFLILSQEPDISVVISDLKMPEMNGIDFFKMLKKKHPKPIRILLTGYADLQNAIDAINEGFIFRFLSKPISPSILKKNIDAAIEQYYLRHNLEISEQALRESNAAKDKFFSIIAHDLRSPLNYLILSSDLLVEKMETSEDDTTKGLVHNFQNYSYKIYHLLEDLLAWSRIQLGQMKPDPTFFSLNEIVQDESNYVEERILRKDITYLLHMTDDFTVYADTGMIKTAFRNLLSNAIKFTYLSGRIIVTAQYTTDKNYIDLSVRDNGIGIANDDIDKIFKLDEQFTTKGTENEKGTGLGLILVREFMTMNHGELLVQSKLNEGSVFTLRIPTTRRNNES